MAARSGLVQFQEIGEKRHIKRAILAQRLKRVLPALEARLGYRSGILSGLAERADFGCPVCLGPISVPHVLVDDEVRGVLCGRCHAAIEKTGGNLLQLREHRRFNRSYVHCRGRLARLIKLYEGSHPAQALGELVEHERAGAHREPGDDPEQ